MSYAYIQLEQYGNGINAARKAIELDPSLKEAILNYALCLIRIGDIQGAVPQLEKFLIDTTGHPMATGLLAVACCINGNCDKGILLFDEIRKMGFDCQEYILDHARKLVAAGKEALAVSLLGCVDKSRYKNQKIESLLVDLSPIGIETPH